MADATGVRLKGYGLALFAAACWATGGLTAKWLFTQSGQATASWPVQPPGIVIDPMELSAGRALTAFTILAVYLFFWRRDELRITTRQMPFLALFGVVGLAGVHFTYFKTISLTNVATAILLEYLAPVLVLMVSIVFMGHRFTWTLPVGVGLSIGGCALVVGVLGGTGLLVTPSGIIWGLVSAVFFATYSLMGSVAVTRFSPFTTLVWGLLFASVFWLVALGPTRVLGLFGDMRTVAVLVVMAVLSTILPFGSFLVALRLIPPTNATVTSTVEPVIAGLGALLLFGETMTWTQIVGGLLVIVAIIVVQLPERAPRPILPPQD